MFDILVWNAQTHYLCAVAMVSHKFQNGTAHASGDASVLNRNDVFEFAKHFVQQQFVERFGKTHVVHSGADSLFFQLFASLKCIIADGSYGQQGDIIAAAKPSARAWLDQLKTGTPVGEHSVTPGITDGERTIIFGLCCVHQVTQFAFVHR